MRFVFLILLLFLIVGELRAELSDAQLQGFWASPKLDPVTLPDTVLCRSGAVYARFRSGRRFDFSDGSFGDECKIKRSENPRADVMLMHLECSAMGPHQVIVAVTKNGELIFRGLFRNPNDPRARLSFVKDEHYLKRYYQLSAERCRPVAPR